ncbi:hypothetical protein ACROYT_G030901 [Oculina patagonica]
MNVSANLDLLAMASIAARTTVMVAHHIPTVIMASASVFLDSPLTATTVLRFCRNQRHTALQSAVKSRSVQLRAQAIAVDLQSPMSWISARIIVTLVVDQLVLFTVAFISIILFHYQHIPTVHLNVTQAATSHAQYTVAKSSHHRWALVQVTAKRVVLHRVPVIAVHHSIFPRLHQLSHHAARYAKQTVSPPAPSTAAI